MTAYACTKMKGIGIHVQSKDWLYILIILSLFSEFSIDGARHSRKGRGRSQLRIVNGTTAEPHELPYQLALTYPDGTFFCGASLINPSYAITAGHCVVEENDKGISYNISPKDIVVRAGKHDLTKNEKTEQKLSVSKVIKHFGYKHNYYDDDLALLKLTRPVSINQYIQPIEMATSKFKATGMVLVSGWGKTGSKPISDVLQKVFVPIVSNAECERMWKHARNSTEKAETTSQQICAGFTSGIKDSCQGDSGGPLVKIIGKTKILVGVVSFGSLDCATPKLPGVYSSISKYRDWIDYNIKK